jgi:hypothetical protein
MIQQLPNLPDGVIGFGAVGAVDASDYKTVLDPAIDAAVAAHQKVNLVFELGEQFERYSLGAMWQDALLEGQPREVWGRVALVTDHRVIGEVIHGLAFLFPGEVKLFPVASLDEAVDWAAKGRRSDTGR